MARARSVSLHTLQELNKTVYGTHDDRMFSLGELQSFQLRFTLRAIKGIRQGDVKKIEKNLPIAVSFFLSIMNRLHLDFADALWDKFPGRCPYCGSTPCSCGNKKTALKKHLSPKGKRPSTIDEFQDMFQRIYPKLHEDLLQSAVHLAEEAGEVSEALYNYRGTRSGQDFKLIQKECADYGSNFFATASAAGIRIGPHLERLLVNGCLACKRSQCECTFDAIIAYR